MCEPRALHASGSGDEVAAQLYAVAPGAPTTQTFGATSPTGGRGRTRRSRLFVEAGAGRKRLPHDALGVGERLPSPRLYIHCWQGHKTESRSAHASQAVGAPGFEPGTSCPPDISFSSSRVKAPVPARRFEMVGAWPCRGSLFWGSILYSRMALARVSTPSVRPVSRTSSCGRLRVSQGKAMHGSRQTRLPVEAIEKTLDVLVLERQRLHEQRSGPEPLEANRRAILYWQRELAQARLADQPVR